MSLKKLGVPGRVQLLGTPDEEGSGAKIKLLDAGAYKGVDASLMGYALPSSLPETQIALDKFDADLMAPHVQSSHCR
jgi:metal-dependent amidase/aminoacylase/carboxypeptidase family protein